MFSFVAELLVFDSPETVFAEAASGNKLICSFILLLGGINPETVFADPVLFILVFNAGERADALLVSKVERLRADFLLPVALSSKKVKTSTGTFVISTIGLVSLT
jgi:hypothetical protein